MLSDSHSGVWYLNVPIRMLLPVCPLFFSPIQLGVGTPGGCEAAAHAARRFLETMPNDNVVVKLDFSNAFNCLHRSDVLKSIADQVPELLPYCH